ncbi:MAG TPA: SCO family protein [Anaerolineales bacterium]|jgi:protein SCO1/2|nr:SCO family protein [Anaerolineales bacterium]
MISLLMAWFGSSAFHINPGTPTPVPIKQVSFEQKLDSQIPLGLTFKDETGRAVKLEDYFAGKPVMLVFAYYECQMLCPLVLKDLTGTLGNLQLNVGEQFQIITVSMDPSETPELAAQEKAEYLEQYTRPGAERGWHFLTGEQDSVFNLADSIGLHFTFDTESKEYAHPTGLVLLTPEGRISRYIFGLDYTANDLRLGLVEASQGEIGTPIDRFYLLCYHYNPVTGRYNLLISNIIRMAAAATALALAITVAFLLRRERRPANLYDSGPI